MAGNTMTSTEGPVNRLKRKMETFPSILELKTNYDTKVKELRKTELVEYAEEEEVDHLDEMIGRMREELASRKQQHFSRYSKWAAREVGYSLDFIEADPETLEKQLKRAKRAVEFMEERIDVHAMAMVVQDLERDFHAGMRKLGEARKRTAEVERDVAEAGKSFMKGGIKWCEEGLEELNEGEEKGVEGAVKKRKLARGRCNSV
ncbi:uncharacterized protein BP5553_03651 [Venustampulla echinocandica]|uniref:Uncharacterized protein n=1 Tax=Venustampulla echinocandica TaxID=2656787 RepID=A0A370TUW0_9HELO|nr:uncharacterized protein BP5553_03651 [Venustampulla echinocandica]RDL39311.1 hypothetical protein BP5553_03651 [Venustampulla echinocandica]